MPNNLSFVYDINVDIDRHDIDNHNYIVFLLDSYVSNWLSI